MRARQGSALTPHLLHDMVDILQPCGPPLQLAAPQLLYANFLDGPSDARDVKGSTNYLTLFFYLIIRIINLEESTEPKQVYGVC